MLTISIYRENLFSTKILLQRRISFCATIYYRTYLKRQPSAEKRRLQFLINHPFYLIIQTVYFHFLCSITAGKLYKSQHSIARAKELQHRAFTKIARISNRVCIWCNETTKKNTSNTLQIRNNYAVSVLFKYEWVRFVARYTSFIDNWNPAVALYTQTIGCNCQCGIVAYVKVKPWHWFGVTEEIYSQNTEYFYWRTPPPRMELYTIGLYQQVPARQI
jgi:hypothetical protein